METIPPSTYEHLNILSADVIILKKNKKSILMIYLDGEYSCYKYFKKRLKEFYKDIKWEDITKNIEELATKQYCIEFFLRANSTKKDEKLFLEKIIDILEISNDLFSKKKDKIEMSPLQMHGM